MGSEHDKVREIQSEIADLNRGAGELMASSIEAIAPHLQSEALLAWATQVNAIAASGWHAWESANLFMRLSPALLGRRGEQALLQCGTYGEGLCGYSFEPSATYFRGIDALLADGSWEALPIIEAAGLRVRQRFSQASNLIADFYRIGFRIGIERGLDQVSDWTELAVDRSQGDRVELSSFLSRSETDASIDWSFVRNLSGVSSDAGIDYMAAFSRIRSELEVDEFAGYESLCLAYARDGEGLDDFFGESLAALAGLGKPARKLLVELLRELPDKSLASSLVSASDDLPWQRPDVLFAWLSGVHDFLPLNTDAAAGFLALESSKSRDRLEALMGRVNLTDCQRVLQLYSEAMTGRRLVIEARPEKVRSIRDLPGTDGKHVFLPEVIDRYRDASRNFTLYKISLLHQLGYYEFGTFDFVRSGVSFDQHFERFDKPNLATAIFQILEDARIDWAIERRYRGAAHALAELKQDARDAMPPALGSAAQDCLLALTCMSLDGDGEAYDLPPMLLDRLQTEIESLRSRDADVFATMAALEACYALVSALADEDTAAREQARASEPPALSAPPVDFRGELDPERVTVNLDIVSFDEEEAADLQEEQQDGIQLTAPIDPRNIKIEQVKKGDMKDGVAMTLTDVELPDPVPEDDDEGETEASPRDDETPVARRRDDPIAYYYDEWDHIISDYRRRWCTLYEVRDMDEVPRFIEDTIRSLRPVANSVRRQLSHLRPELLRKVRGMEDGEELDLEKAIESLVDRHAGLSPEERIYVQRQRRDRDVAALFLLDMSASTDDRIPLPAGEEGPPPPRYDEDDFLHDYYGAKAEVDTRKRIIDVEKEAVALMANALELLGDNYAVCGFSGYGKDQVDFYLCKDFTEALTARAKGRIGGIKPCRSTRMGPAIRHATRRLVATESRVKALIILSDGYPQDFDYGKDRNSKDYGIKDTTMALTEARQQGISAFCLTVDPSGHDYLREMCPDQSYMVIQDIEQLPDELSKVYRSLTA